MRPTPTLVKYLFVCLLEHVSCVNTVQQRYCDMTHLTGLSDFVRLTAPSYGQIIERFTEEIELWLLCFFQPPCPPRVRISLQFVCP